MPTDSQGRYYSRPIDLSDPEEVSERLTSAARGAMVGAKVGSLVPLGGTAVGTTLGAIGGFILGDQETVFPIDMIAIPAYQAYMLAGTPAFQIYIKEGEVLTQVMPTDAMQAAQAVDMQAGTSKAMKKRKANPWIKFSKKFEYRKRRKSESPQEYLSKRNKAASRAYKKGKGETKKGQVRKTARRAYEKKK